ncbi:MULTISPECIES: ATP-dependent endonuclease [Pseudomonas]|jgi:predicted ATPase|uniref:ATP-dependent nuclease n=1 Tax=Pseudomonas TaxID=286 RepID=UPI0008763A92|nr:MULTISPECIES: AAA family ATPase [Pseudomonas]SCZ41216.1 AAA domain-containing protein, putative AbiEii toxin, Type IV TA system [Pseudomonas sp. NFIX46]SDB51363.1 AAA domain-containing protein, putative AbiEii toxin, Type IV TA system [Pseudomonas putida]SFQ92836.1 AAA domain-containing protein, putative AbiEii toxin, Type IV TA system [Pseudomonas sp. NFIX49]
MADFAKKIQSKYIEKNRYSNFGSSLRKVVIEGFRGISSLELNLDYPITVISGLNGAGKSTLGQLAICAYKKPSTATDYKRQYIKDFFPVSPADPKPISDDAKVTYFYETDDHKKPQEVSVARAKSAWSGYKRQPERHCYYVGFTVYIPKVERRDLSIYGGARLLFTDKREIEEDIIKKMAKIIGHKYDDVNFQGISHKGKELEVGIASRLGYSYSENNMGFGEGRILYTVDALETSPEQSLFILEEPETSLHESAQYEFAKYLIDVCNRRHHQIILSTHSSVIIGALPSEARKLILRDENGVEIIDRISSNQVRSILSSGHVRQLDICVEDIFAKVLLTEVIRLKRKELLKTVAIHDIGDKDAVREAVRVLQKTGKKAIAVRDADVGSAPQESLYSFPGSRPPEVEVFQHPDIQNFLKKKYGLDVNWVLEKNSITDHHKFAQCLAAEAETEESVIRTNAIEQYILRISDEFDTLIESIERHVNL